MALLLILHLFIRLFIQKNKKKSTFKKNGECDCDCNCEDGSVDTIASDGRCPCKCKCKSCKISKKTKTGCDCPGDNQKCPNGKVGFWQNCKFQCAGCGKPPVCLPGTQGEYCHLPRCPNRCPNCNNGICVLSESCTSSCRCNPGWTGLCCDQAVTLGFGDVHYQTLDQLVYDFQGVGEFWYCQDIQNDQGIQARAYMTKLNSSVSWLAGVAVKLKSTILSAYLGPVVRLNGSVVAEDTQLSLEADNSVYVSIRFDESGHPKILAQVKERFDIKITYSTSASFGFFDVDLKIDESYSRLRTRGLCGSNDG